MISGKVTKPKLVTQKENLKKLSSDNKFEVRIKNKIHLAEIYSRDEIEAGNFFNGPAIVTQSDTTTFILPNYKVNVDKYLNLIIKKERNLIENR